VVAATVEAGCTRAPPSGARLGDAARGRAAIRSAGCGTCHTIPGVFGAKGNVGPPLTAFARRRFIAGQVPNTPENLVRWLRDPQSVERNTAMPNAGLDERAARDVAAYLYTLSRRPSAIARLADALDRAAAKVGGRARERTNPVPGGDPDRGRADLASASCGTCHVIPGVAGAAGTDGPPLGAFGSRAYIAGEVTNTPDNLIRWIRDPESIEKNTAMPSLGVDDRTARDMAAYLYTLH
jgi:cytochrome c